MDIPLGIPGFHWSSTTTFQLSKQFQSRFQVSMTFHSVLRLLFGPFQLVILGFHWPSTLIFVFHWSDFSFRLVFQYSRFHWSSSLSIYLVSRSINFSWSFIQYCAYHFVLSVNDFRIPLAFHLIFRVFPLIFRVTFRFSISLSVFPVPLILVIISAFHRFAIEIFQFWMTYYYSLFCLSFCPFS